MCLSGWFEDRVDFVRNGYPEGIARGRNTSVRLSYKSPDNFGSYDIIR